MSVRAALLLLTRFCIQLQDNIIFVIIRNINNFIN